MTDKPVLVNSRAHRFWRSKVKIGDAIKQATFVPCPVAPPLSRKEDDVTESKDANDVKPVQPIRVERPASEQVIEYPDPLTPPEHLSEIIKSTEEDMNKSSQLSPGLSNLRSVFESLPSPTQVPKSPQMTSPKLISKSPQMTSSPTGSPTATSPLVVKSGKPAVAAKPGIFPKDLSGKSHVFRFPADKKTPATNKMTTGANTPPGSPASPSGYPTSPPLSAGTPPASPVKKKTSIKLPIFPNLQPKNMVSKTPEEPIGGAAATDNNDEDADDLPNFPADSSIPLEVSSDFPPPPPGITANAEHVSPSYFVPRKPPRPINTDVQKRIARYDDVDHRNGETTTNIVDVGRKSDDERSSVALHKSLGDLLSHIDKSLPNIRKDRKTPPETKTPTNSLESSQEFLDGRSTVIHHAPPGRDVTTITEEDMATKFDNISQEEPMDGSDGGCHTTAIFDDTTSQTDDVSMRCDEALAQLDEVNAEFDDVTPEEQIIDDDFAAFLGLDELDDCLDLINEEIETQKSDQACAITPQPQKQPIEGADDSDDSSDYEFPIGNKVTVSTPLPPPEMPDEPLYVNNELARAALFVSDEEDEPPGPEIDRCESPDLPPFPTMGGSGLPKFPPYPTSDRSESPDDLPPYPTDGRSESPELPPPPHDDVTDFPATQQFFPAAIEDSATTYPDEDETYDTPSSIRASQAYIDESDDGDSMTYDVPRALAVLKPVPCTTRGDSSSSQQNQTSSSYGQEKMTSPPPSPSRKVTSPPLSPSGKVTPPPPSPLGKMKSPLRSPSVKMTSPPKSPSGKKTSPPKSPSQTKVCGRPPPPNDAPPKPQSKKFWKKKKQKTTEKPGKAPPLPPKDPDLLATRHKPVGEEEEEDPYCCIDEILAKSAGQKEVGDDDWNSDDNEIYEDFEDWD